MIAIAAAAGISIALALTLVRWFAGPTLYDRALVASAAITKAALLCAAIGALTSQPEAIDVAFVLLLASFVLAAAALKFFRLRTFQAPMARTEDA